MMDVKQSLKDVMVNMLDQCGEEVALDALESALLEQKPESVTTVDAVDTQVYPVASTVDPVLRTVGPVVPDVDPVVETVDSTILILDSVTPGVAFDAGVILPIDDSSSEQTGFTQ